MMTEVPNVRLGNYIEVCNARNSDLKYGIDMIEGVNSKGEFCSPKAAVDGINLLPYKIVDNGDFVYNPSRLNIGSLALRTTGRCIVSHLYVVFHLTKEGQNHFLPEFLWLYFSRESFRDLVTFRNFGSQRPEFNFYQMSEIQVPHPDIEVQRDLVAIYGGLQKIVAENDALISQLESVCHDFVVDCKSKYPKVKLGNLITQRHEKYVSGDYPIRGVTRDGFIPPKQKDADLSLYNVFYKDDFVFNPARMEINSIALNTDFSKAICSSLYEIFFINDTETLLPEYLNLFLKSDEFSRFCEYDAIGSARNYFRVSNIQNVKIPLSPIDIQRSIAAVAHCLSEAKRIVADARELMKNLCPALIQKAAHSA